MTASREAGTRSRQEPLSRMERLQRAGLLAFAATLVYLTAAYLGGPFVIVWWICVIAAVAGTATTCLGVLALRLVQGFSTEHPVKGQVVEYRLIVENPLLIAVPFVRLVFKQIRRRGGTSLEDESLFLPGHGSLDRTYRISTPYRGIYTVGLESIEVAGPLRILTLPRRVWFRTFYVYPRIVPLRSFLPGVQKDYDSGSRSRADGAPDFSLFHHIRDYRRNEPTRHLDWKRLGGTGRPFVKEYESSAEPAVSIYLDLRPPPAAGDPLIVEDTSIEVVVALAYHFLSADVPVTVAAIREDEPFRFLGRERSDFERLYRDAIELEFTSRHSPLAAYRTLGQEAVAGAASVVVSHLLDGDVLTACEHADAGTFVLNRTALGTTSSADEVVLAGLVEAGRRVVVVTDPGRLGVQLEGGA